MGAPVASAIATARSTANTYATTGRLAGKLRSPPRPSATISSLRSAMIEASSQWIMLRRPAAPDVWNNLTKPTACVSKYVSLKVGAGKALANDSVTYPHIRFGTRIGGHNETVANDEFWW